LSSLHFEYFLSRGPPFPISTNSLIFHTELIFAFAKIVILCYRCLFSIERKYVRRDIAATVSLKRTHLLPRCYGKFIIERGKMKSSRNFWIFITALFFQNLFFLSDFICAP
jgi:hypothetical protein